MREKIKCFISDFINIDVNDIAENADIRTDLAFDSLALLNLVTAIENEFCIEITEDDIKGLETVSGFIELVENKVNTK